MDEKKVALATLKVLAAIGDWMTAAVDQELRATPEERRAALRPYIEGKALSLGLPTQAIYSLFPEGSDLPRAAIGALLENGSIAPLIDEAADAGYRLTAHGLLRYRRLGQELRSRKKRAASQAPPASAQTTAKGRPSPTRRRSGGRRRRWQ